MRLSAATPVPSIGWAVTAATREEDVTGPILSSIAKSALLFLSVSLVAFFIALVVSRKINKTLMYEMEERNRFAEKLEKSGAISSGQRL